VCVCLGMCDEQMSHYYAWAKCDKIQDIDGMCITMCVYLYMYIYIHKYAYIDSPDVDIDPIHEEDGGVVVHVEERQLAPLLS
jgi:hypothetical protein